jgi:dihydroorotase
MASERSSGSFLLRGATLVDAAGERLGDLRVRAGTIVEIASSLAPVIDEEVIDSEGCYLLPAFVDLHTHLREPGGERAETILSGTRAGALGGYRCVVAMPNTIPAIDSVEVVRHLRQLAKAAPIEVAISAAITRGRRGEELVEMSELAAEGVVLFTDDGRGVQDDGVMRAALEMAHTLGVTLGQHCEHEGHAKGAPMHEGAWSSRLGLAGQPRLAEIAMVARDLALVEELDASMHFLHLSTAEAIEMVRTARARGLRVTAEATPHHLALTHAEVASFDPVFRVNPPLRESADVRAVRTGLVDGTIDAIATDHAPHSPETKDEPFDCAPPGMIGLETAFAVAHTELVVGAHLRVADASGAPKLTMGDLVRLFSTAPAKIARVDDQRGSGTITVGAPADLVLFDPKVQWRVDEDRGASRSRNTPFAHLDLVGRIRHHLHDGQLIVRDAELVL